MRLIVPRSVTVGGEGRDGRLGAGGDHRRAAPLADFRSERAYVLLGDPGAGKTEAFGTECQAVPGSVQVTARRFISRGLDRHPEWRAETLFIDGLDEVRAGRPDARRPMDLILERLEHLGSPNFRLSCRAADWLGRNDLQEIVSTAGYGNVRVLHLEPLRGEDILRILADLGVPDPRGFMGEAGERGLEGLLSNPHSLGLLVKAKGRDEWPRDRRTTFENACRALARELNDEHRAVQRSAPFISLDRIMAAAGHLSVLLLLSDKEHVSIDASEDPDSLCVEDIPEGDHPALLRALRSNLFSVHPDGGFVPPHRQLAEFLGARFLHTRIDSGVPASRVLALMTGEDGVVVTELRGLSAWLAAFDGLSRRSLIRTDPVGIALYGDIHGFRSDEKESLLRAFAERADEIKAWSWPPVALASLIDSHTLKLLDGYLGDEERGDGRQAVVGLLLSGLAHASGAQPSRSRLEQAVRDVTWQPWVRQLALRALLRHAASGEDGVPTLRALLDDIRDGRVEDRDGELAGTLLSELYLGREVESRLDAQRQSEARTRAMEMQVREQASQYLADDNRQKAEFVAHVRKHAPELKEGTCPPGLLHHIAECYHDVFDYEAASTPRARLTQLLDGHADLVEASLAGFRRVARRPDHPALREIIRLNEQGQRSLYDLPVLAGFDQMSPESLDSCPSAEITRAAAFAYLTPVNLSGQPEWFLRTLERRPRAVAEALIKVTRSRIRRRVECSYLWHLARESSYRAVAGLAVVPLLRAFPTRCTEPQVSALHEVLLAAVRWQPSGIEEAIRVRAARPGMDVSQHALWLAAGLFLSPDEYLSQLATFVEGGEEARSRQVVRFMAPRGVEVPQRSWRTSALGRLIRLLGSRYSPWRAPSPGVASFVDEDRMRVEGLITRWVADLASRTDPDACSTLQSLVDNPALESWRWSLTQERSRQIVARRDATFAVPELKAIQVTLANDRPANPADLAALVAARLELLAPQIPRSNTDDWRQYWNEGSSSLPRPKHEDACRDALLSDLRQLLPDGVDAQPEGHYAREKRADIRVSFNGSAIPVEIKKDSHRKLWSAAGDQLVRQYTIDPESSGYGIYLVLWFGLGKMPVPPTGRRPRTPDALRQRLEERLEGPYRHKVRVLVIDVRAPDSRTEDS